MKNITTIIPSIRGGDPLIRSINSVLNQTILPKKVIVVISDINDVKRENIVKHFNEYTNIKFISSINKISAPKARNIGFDNSDSDLVHFLDDDDYLSDSFYADTLNNWSSDEIIGISHSVQWISDKDNTKNYSIRKFNSISQRDLIKENYVGITSSVVLRSSIFRKVGGFSIDMKARQDYDLWLKMARYGIFKTLKKINVFWTHHIDNYSISNSNKIDKHIEAIGKLRKKKKELLTNYNDLFLKLSSESNHYLYLARRTKRINIFYFLKYAFLSFICMPNIKIFVEIIPYFISRKIRMILYKYLP